MRAGRKPKPTHLKLLQGKPGHRPLPEAEPEPDLVLDENMPPPAGLTGDGMVVWAAEFPKMVRNGMLTEVDINAFMRYCDHQGRYLMAVQMVQKQGDVIIAPSGFPVQNPYLTIANRSAADAHKAETEFGMTPSSRSRVPATGAKKKANRFLDIINGSKTKGRA